MLRDFSTPWHGTPLPPAEHSFHARHAVFDAPAATSCTGRARSLWCSRALSAANCDGEDARGELARLRARVAELETEIHRKDLLLRDTNHRAKNAFATISSLIAMEMAGVRDARARGILELTQERLAAVALVHEALQGKSDSATLDLGALLPRLGEALAFSMGAQERGIDLHVQAPAMLVDAGTAVSIALIANELMTNAFKYAFPDRAAGRIELSLRLRGGRLVLRVRDDGVGAPDATQGAGTGLGLVHALAGQSDGRVRLVRCGTGGTAAIVVMPR